MSKTNHRRVGDKPRKDSVRYQHSPIGGTGDLLPLSDKHIGAGWGGDNANGHAGFAHVKAGAKKFVRTRRRFHENQATKKLAQDKENIL